jgi:sugar phosphate isomerase/epimerase
MKLVFICSPFQGKRENIENAKEYCRFALEQGVIPIAPHVYFSQFMDDSNPEERRKALEMNKKLMEFCDELWIFGDEITEGMREEIEHFRKIKGKNNIRKIKNDLSFKNTQPL